MYSNFREPPYLPLSILQQKILLNNDLDKVNLWASKWKISLNSDPSKQAQEVIFSWEINKVYHPNLFFNKSTIQQISSQKHL